MAESVIRLERRGGFTVLPTGMLRDPRLSLRTKGLFAVMLSLPDGWEYSISGLAAINGVGKDTIRSALKEMEKAGYLKREQSHGEGGRFGGNVYIIREESASAPLSEKPTTVEPSSAEPSSENPTELNIDRSSIDLIDPPLPPQGEKAEKIDKRRRSKSVPKWMPERFEAFWKFYPRHEDRVSAVREWDRLKPSDKLIDQIARALLWQTKDPDWPTPYACRYLRNQRWTDEPPVRKERDRYVE